MKTSKAVMCSRWLCGVLFSALSAIAQADSLMWHYQWMNPSGEALSVAIPMPDSMLDMAYLNPRDAVNYRTVSQYIMNQMEYKAASLATDEAHITLEGDSMSNLVIRQHAKQGREYHALLMKQEVLDFAKTLLGTLPQWSYFYNATEHGSLMLDYNAIATDYQLVAEHLVLALSDMLETEDKQRIATTLLDMLQSLEYNDMSNEDFPLFNPARMLIERQGDCESKQLLLAMGLNILYPDSDVMLVPLLDQEHIVLALEHPGQPRIYMDATGPSRLPAGTLHPNTDLEGNTLEIHIRS